MNDMVATESQGHPAPGAKSQHELAEMIRDRGSRTSSGPADVSAAPTGRTYDRSRPNRSERQKTLVRKGPSTYGAASLWNRSKRARQPARAALSSRSRTLLPAP